jgi:hypothetical protein
MRIGNPDIMCFPLCCSAAGVPAMRSAVRLGGAGADARGGLLPRGLPVRTVRPRPSGSPSASVISYYPCSGSVKSGSGHKTLQAVVLGHPDQSVRCPDPDPSIIKQ